MMLWDLLISAVIAVISLVLLILFLRSISIVIVRRMTDSYISRRMEDYDIKENEKME